jgi:hypothetical protein
MTTASHTFPIGPHWDDSPSPYGCGCDECSKDMQEQADFEMAAERRNEEALYGATPAMEADYEREREMEAGFGPYNAEGDCCNF